MEITSDELGEYLGQFISGCNEENARWALENLCNRKAILNITVQNTLPVIQKVQVVSNSEIAPKLPYKLQKCHKLQFERQNSFQPNIQAASLCSQDRIMIKERLLKDGVPEADALRISLVCSSYIEAMEKYRNEPNDL